MRKLIVADADIVMINNFTSIIKSLKFNDIEIVNARLEYTLKNIINNKEGDIFIFNSTYENMIEHIEKIKKINSTIPIFIYGGEHSIYKECNMQFILNYTDYNLEENVEIILRNIYNYIKTFDKLLSITTTVKDALKFDDIFTYYPTSRSLFKNENLIKVMTNKEGSILEILLNNYGEIVSKQLILEKIWGKNEHYASRSMDVYVSNLRKLLSINDVKSKINSVTGKNPGLIFTVK